MLRPNRPALPNAPDRRRAAVAQGVAFAWGACSAVRMQATISALPGV